MKKLIFLLFLSIIFSSCSNKTYQPALQDFKKQDQATLYKVNKGAMENKSFKDDLTFLNYYIAQGLTITPESFEPYIDTQRGIVVLPSIRFVLTKGVKVSYSSKEEWKDKSNRTYTGYVFDTNSDSKDGSNPRLMFIEKESSQDTNQILYFSLIEYKGERYKLKSNFTTHLNYGVEEEVETITIKNKN